MNFTLDQHGSWANGIGRLILAFAGIEAATVSLLRTISLSKIDNTSARFQLQQRIDLLLEICSSQEDRGNLVTVLRDVKSLSVTRNLVAHNPLVVEISIHPENKFITKEMIQSRHNERIKISLQELLVAAEKAEQLERKLYLEVELRNRSTGV